MFRKRPVPTILPSPFGNGSATDDTPDAGIVMYSTRWCADCRRARRVFDALGVTYHEVDIDADEDAATLVQRLNHGARSVPTILFPDGTRLVEPAAAALSAKLAAYLPPTH